ncbi:MAG: GDP-mannose 4,6-dehydratase [Chloroflexi bacterium]|nr:GDP-mannose 4,6-dehydratase [Chloroflexota bacterium]
MNWSAKPVFITGAGGFIGSHLVELLVRSGARVRTFVRYNSRSDWGFLELLPKTVLKELEVVSGDLRDSDAVRGALKGADVVFHLGSLIAIPYSYVHPRETIETNVLGTLNILTAARDNDVGKVVHVSTSEVYGTARYVPMDEGHPLQGQSPYSASKIGADMVAESFYRSYKVPVATIRPFNTFGPRQSARAVIPTIITQAWSFNRVTLGSLHPTRDFTYVEDMARAFLLVAESAGAVGQAINVGSGFEISVGDLADKIFKLMGKECEIVSEDRRVRPAPSEVERLWCDNRKATAILGWAPSLSLEEGLKKTIAWLGDNLSLYKPDLYAL